MVWRNLVPMYCLSRARSRDRWEGVGRDSICITVSLALEVKAIDTENLWVELAVLLMRGGGGGMF